jgi:hypothetical protein
MAPAWELERQVSPRRESVSRERVCRQSVSQSRVATAEAGDSSGTHRKGISAAGSRYQAVQ